MRACRKFGSLMARPDEAAALFYERNASVVLNAIRMPPASDGGVTIRTLHSAVSRGTERLVLAGKVPESERARMRCPHQEGDFTFPVKYGYAAVGVIEDGANAGTMVFCLHPHQSRFRVSADSVVPIPDGIQPRRATLAANMETAVNVLWDAGVSIGDRVVIVGAGVVGLLIARLAAQIPGTEVVVSDLDENRRSVVEAMGADFAASGDLCSDVDVAINASANPAGLADALASLADEGMAVEASWLGSTPSALPLGEAFHSRRLTIRSSQVGRIPPSRAPRWTHRRRLELAVALTEDPALDVLLTHDVPLAAAPARLPGLILDEPSALAITISYPD